MLVQNYKRIEEIKNPNALETIQMMKENGWELLDEFRYARTSVGSGITSEWTTYLMGSLYRSDEEYEKQKKFDRKL